MEIDKREYESSCEHEYSCCILFANGGYREDGEKFSLYYNVSFMLQVWDRMEDKWSIMNIW
jgi:hypothetical protein